MLWNICTTLSVVFVGEDPVHNRESGLMGRPIDFRHGIAHHDHSVRFGQSLTRTAETESLPVQAGRCGAVEPRSARTVASCG
jgi:hypothetical protein